MATFKKVYGWALFLCLGYLLNGCDFGAQPDNEYVEAVISAYEDTFADTLSADENACMRSFTRSYVARIDRNGVTGVTYISPVERTIQVLNSISDLDKEAAMTHEYVHALLFCLHFTDWGSTHADPLFWTCTDSIEVLAADMYGKGAPNGCYVTKCAKETQPENYLPNAC